MRYYFSILLFCLVSIGLYGQSLVSIAVGTESFDFRVGSSGSGGAFVSYTPMGGVTTNVAYFTSLGSNKGVYVELGYTVASSSITESYRSRGGGTSTGGTYKFRKANIAVLPGFLLGNKKKFFLGAGLYVSTEVGDNEVLVTNRWSSPFDAPGSSERIIRQNDVLEKTELGLQLRASWTFPLSNVLTISPELGGRFGLSDFARFSNGKSLYSKRLGLQVRLGYLL